MKDTSRSRTGEEYRVFWKPEAMSGNLEMAIASSLLNELPN
ncbi:hypothetical protein [Thermoleptolyngbya sp.]|jgi:hypothetical protein